MRTWCPASGGSIQLCVASEAATLWTAAEGLARRGVLGNGGIACLEGLAGGGAAKGPQMWVPC